MPFFAVPGHVPLQLAPFAVKVSVNPNDLIPLLHVFGMFSPLPDASGIGQVSREQRMATYRTAREEKSIWVPKRHISLGVRSHVLSDADEV